MTRLVGKRVDEELSELRRQSGRCVSRFVTRILGQRPTTWHELHILAGVLGVTCALLAFASLAEEIGEGETQGFDRAVMLALRQPTDPGEPIGPNWLKLAARDFTSLGSHAVLATITLAVAGYLALNHMRGAALLVLTSVAGGMTLSAVLKLGLNRERPNLVPHVVEVYTASFPSGHAMLSAVTYLTLGALLTRVQPRWLVKAYVLALAVLITLLVGASRVYLGVHWPTDVLGAGALVPGGHCCVG